MDQCAPDIRFEPGDNFVLVMDTDSYAGNFEREMASYVMGAMSDGQYHGKKEKQAFQRDAKAEPALKAIQRKVTWQSHIEYGEVVATIWPTPPLEATASGQRTETEYNSVAVFLSEPLTAAEVQLIQTRARDFAAKRTRADTEPLHVTGLRQLNVNLVCQVLPVSP